MTALSVQTFLEEDEQSIVNNANYESNCAEKGSLKS